MKLFNLLTLTPLLLTAIVFAEETENKERWFQVEVMVFKNPVLETDNPEAWPTYAEIQHPDTFIRLEGISEIITDNSETEDPAVDEDNTPKSTVEVEPPTSDKGLEAFVALSEFERRLLEEREKIEGDRRYELLFHEAWNQPVPGRDTVIPIRIDGGERFGRQSELQGYINLYVERYLHLSTDLHLIEYQKSTDPFSVVDEQANTDSPNDTLDIFGGLSLLNADSLTNNQISRKSDQFFVSVKDAHLKENRRMRSKHIHYLDNPEFGMLVLITPIDIQ